MQTPGEPHEEFIDALNEDLSRILLGEGLTLRLRLGKPGGTGNSRHPARLLLQEMAQIVRKLEQNTDVSRAEARRLRDITAALLDLLDPPARGRAAV